MKRIIGGIEIPESGKRYGVDELLREYLRVLDEEQEILIDNLSRYHRPEDIVRGLSEIFGKRDAIAIVLAELNRTRVDAKRDPAAGDLVLQR